MLGGSSTTISRTTYNSRHLPATDIWFICHVLLLAAAVQERLCALSFQQSPDLYNREQDLEEQDHRVALAKYDRNQSVIWVVAAAAIIGSWMQLEGDLAQQLAW